MDGGERPPPGPMAVASSAGTSLVGPVVLGLLLDVQLGWTPWATLTGILLGLFGCLSVLWLMSNRRDK